MVWPQVLYNLDTAIPQTVYTMFLVLRIVHVALINMRITYTNSQTVTIYEKWFGQNTRCRNR